MYKTLFLPSTLCRRNCSEKDFGFFEEFSLLINLKVVRKFSNKIPIDWRSSLRYTRSFIKLRIDRPKALVFLSFLSGQTNLLSILSFEEVKCSFMIIYKRDVEELKRRIDSIYKLIPH